MAGLKVFVSSTCYDLSVIRSQLRIFLQTLGHEPIMSEYSDVLYDPRTHTHTSCVEEVNSADMVIMIIGSRFGGTSVPEALSKIDFDQLLQESGSTKSLISKENLSITQLEILKAVELNLPVFTFIDSSVWNDHALYEKNKDKPIISEIEFPSIDKPKTALFIFEFINFLRHRTRGNSVFSFTKLQDIEDVLRKQWSALFQRLLNEQKSKNSEIRRIENLSEQFEDLKTAILSTLGSSNEKDIAKGVIRYRRLVGFIKSFLKLTTYTDYISFLTKGKNTWNTLLESAEIQQIENANNYPSLSLRGPRAKVFFIKNDKTFFEAMLPMEFINEMQNNLEEFVQLSEDIRKVIVEALEEVDSYSTPLRYISEPFDKFINQQLTEEKRYFERKLELNIPEVQDVSL